MHDSIRYFFGAGTEVEFRNFTLAHLLPILVAAGVIFLIWRFRKQLQTCKHEGYFRYDLAFMRIFTTRRTPKTGVNGGSL